MTSEQAPLLAPKTPKGTYAPAGPDDKRSPCPMINALANHGYLPRNGQNVLAHEMKAAMNEVGLSKTLGGLFVNSVYNVHQEKGKKTETGIFSTLWSTIRNPWTLLSRLGMRRPGQTDSSGRPVLNLDQLALHGTVEHDVSLTRRDHAQTQGNCARQEDLVNNLLACSTDGKKITREELAAFRKQRITKQREDNPGLTYGPLEHELGCGEVALILSVLGDGKSVPYEYVATFLKQEKLPIEEGWKKRWWWTVGLIEVKLIATKVKSLIGMHVK